VLIAGGEAIPYSLPFRAAYVTASGRINRREMVLLRLRDEKGRVGWGEGVPLSLRGGDPVATVVGDLERWLAAADGRDLAWREGTMLDGLCPPARCAVLTALADLEGRRCGEPVWQLLGAERCDPVTCNATLVSGPPERVAADAAEWAAAGFSTFKLKVGQSPKADLALIEAVRDTVGPGARIRLDANGAWSIETAFELLEAAAPLLIELVEQPVTSLAEMALLRSRLHQDGIQIPIAADESVNDPAEALAAAGGAAESDGATTATGERACDLATVKLSKLGCLRPTLGPALPFYLSSALDGPVGIAAAAHAFQALDQAERAPLAQGLATQRLFDATIAVSECELRSDRLHLPPGPGLGVEIDETALDARRL